MRAQQTACVRVHAFARAPLRRDTRHATLRELEVELAVRLVTIVAGAAADAGVPAIILERFHAAPDHPVLLEFPEGEYLKGLLLRKV